MLSVPTGLSKLKTKLNKLGVDNLKTVPIDLKKKNSYVLSKEVVKKTMCNKLNTTVNNLEIKLPIRLP